MKANENKACYDSFWLETLVFLPDENKARYAKVPSNFGNLKKIGLSVVGVNALQHYNVSFGIWLYYSQDSISVTPISVIISYMLRKFYSPTKTQLVRLMSVMC